MLPRENVLFSKALKRYFLHFKASLIIDRV